ncbi:hypothetical protein [Amphibacillus indicireducens]|uniref:Uncharacterized protein n=1 Tax=Amphibacillus indicireducens TaxID=1076330 RepID=A0ABP7V744_9BACI
MLIIFTLFQAYATFPNGGQRPEGHFIKKIVGPTGNIIVDFKPKETEVTTAEVAKEMTKLRIILKIRIIPYN